DHGRSGAARGRTRRSWGVRGRVSTPRRRPCACPLSPAAGRVDGDAHDAAAGPLAARRRASGARPGHHRHVRGVDGLARRQSRGAAHPSRGGTTLMPTMEEYAKQPRRRRRQRLPRTADELSAAIKGQTEAVLARRPDDKNWAAKEIVCHLRDAEEMFPSRFELIVAMDTDPKLVGPSADRMAEERQYLRNDAGEAIGAFRRRRAENVEYLRKLTPAQWDK